MAIITMLGAGSGFTAGLMRDIIQIPGFDAGEIRLVDIDAKRLSITEGLIRNLAKHLKGDSWKVSGTTDRTKALKGTDYIINCIEVSGMECVRFDNDIPAMYGIDQCIGDTIGPGGIFKALRTVPAWISILQDVEKYCPRALVLNYTNPMSIMTLAALRNTSAQVVGLCHSVQGSSHEMAQISGVPYKEMDFRCAGVNHLAWFTELSHKGKDLYPLIFDRVRKEPAVYETNPVRFEMMLHFGAFVTESSGHFSEYLPYFRKRPDLITKYCRDGYRGGSSFYADNWPTWRAESDRRRAELAKDITKMDLNRGYEYASEIIEAHALNVPKVIYGSVMNNGLISNLLPDNVAEVAVLVNRNGFNPCRFGELPPQMAAICRSHQAVYDLVVRGIMNQDREAIAHAMMLDPLASAVCCPAEIREMTERMAAAEKDYIPAFMSKGLSLPTGFIKQMKQDQAKRAAKHDEGKLANFEVSQAGPKVKSIKSAKLPGREIKFAPVQARPDKFIDIRDRYNGVDGLVYLKTSFSLNKGGNGLLLCGPDGPFKVWVNDKEVGNDPKCGNPAVPTKYRFQTTWKKGKNTVVFALDTHEAKAWGLFAQYRM